jgi:beta-lactamase regulating signal transducer with metallopeptidase domain
MNKSSLLTFLFNATWQVMLIASLASIGSILLRKTSARYRHWLWMIALVLSLFIPLLTSSRVVLEGLLTNAPSSRVQPVTPFQGAPTQEVPRLPVESTFSLKLDSRIALAIGLIYFAFVAFRLFRLVQAWRTTRRIRATAFQVELSPLVTDVIRNCESLINVRSEVGILCSTQIPVPITIGVLRPVIILPQQLLLEENVELLTSAIGHELVHVERRDYLLNLLCEVLFLPVSFNPFAALLRRRIKQTRELSCDELVAARILSAEAYARSLVRLVSSVPTLHRLSATTTVGIADADILEARIMSLLNRPKLETRWKSLLLVGVSFLLIVPCVAAAAFGTRYNIGTKEQVSQDPKQREQEIVEKRREQQVMGEKIREREMSPQMREEMTRKRQIEMEMVAVKQAALFNLARISMDQAIQIANSQYPGKVLQCSLDVDKWEEPGKIAKDGKIFYRVVVISTEGGDTIGTHVWVNAVDGTIIKTEKEFPRKPREN